MSEWKEYRLGEIAEVFNFKRVPLNTREREKRKGIYPYYGASGIVDYIDAYLFDGEYVLISEDGENLRSRKTPIAYNAKGKFWVNNHAHIVKGKHRFINDWLVYYFKNLDINPFITGAVQPKLNLGNLLSIPIIMPSFSKAESIAEILSSLDDKIELNNEINKNLEALAQALFKQWFVDFEFPDNNGQPYKSSGGEMVESDVGLIPKGWKIRNLKGLSECSDSKRIPLSSMERRKRIGIYPYYGAASILDYIDDNLFEGNYVLMGEDGSVTDQDGFPILQYVSGKFWVNNHAHILKGKEISTELLYCLLRNTNISHLVTGAVQPKLNQQNMNTISMALPQSIDKLKPVENVLYSCFSKLRQVIKENIELSKLRDTLLPKLISGELKVKEAIKQTEKVL